MLSLCTGWRKQCPRLGLKTAVAQEHPGVAPGGERACDLDWRPAPEALDAERGAEEPPAIRLPQLHALREGVHQIVAHLCRTFTVPADERYDLFCAVRQAKMMGTLADRRALVHGKLCAIFVLLACSPMNYEGVAAFTIEDPDFATELVSLLAAEHECPVELRTMALR